MAVAYGHFIIDTTASISQQRRPAGTGDLPLAESCKENGVDRTAHVPSPIYCSVAVLLTVVSIPLRPSFPFSYPLRTFAFLCARHSSRIRAGGIGRGRARFDLSSDW